ncbi:hypothetical protein BDW75DRAFT_244098 [Aspergillus navahoensis]
MEPHPIDGGGGYDSEDDEIFLYSDHSGLPQRHGSARALGCPRGPAYVGDDEAGEYAVPFKVDRETCHHPSPRGYTDNCFESRQRRGEHSTRSSSRLLNYDDDILYYTKYRNPAKDLPIERDPEGINMYKVRQHTRPGRPRESSRHREFYKVQVDEYEDDLPPRTSPGHRGSRALEAYKVQVEEYEDDLPPRSRTGRREPTQPGRRSSRYADYMEPVELYPLSGSPGSSRPSWIGEDVDYEIREPRGYCSSRAARRDDSYQDHSSTQAQFKERRPCEPRAGGRHWELTYDGHDHGQNPDDSDDVDVQAKKSTYMLPDMFSKFNINTDP